MEFIQLDFYNMPNIVFAHSSASERYSMNFQKRDICEIAYIEKGGILRTMASGEQIYMETPCVITIPPNHQMSLKSSGPHKHITVAFETFTQNKITNNDIALRYKNDFMTQQSGEAPFAILPEFILEKNVANEVARLIRLIIVNNNAVKPSNGLLALAALMELLGCITEYSYKMAIQESNCLHSEMRYCERAVTLIMNDIGRKWSVNDLSADLNISNGHLSRLFKKNTGRSIIDYINKIKIEHAQLLISVKQMSIKDAVLHIGISDVKYFYHLFKKYTGMTPNEYMNMKHYEHL